jgi:hypothetical protein
MQLPGAVGRDYFLLTLTKDGGCWLGCTGLGNVVANLIAED